MSDKLLKAKELHYKKARLKLINFLKPSWRVLEPSKPLLINWHHSLISEYLEACENGEIKRLIINIPPRYTKSNLVTVTFPIWLWLRDPALRFIFASYSQTLATKHSTDRRALIESDWFKEGYGNVFQLRTDQNVKTEFENNHRGVMLATSMLGSATGKGGDYIVIDDPHNPLGAESDVKREAVIEAYSRTFSTRLNDKKNGVIIVVMQRLHERDLSGHLLSEGGWTHLKIPGIAPETKTYIYPISKRQKVFKAGELLHEERENHFDIQKQKVSLGSYGFAGQYQQEPSPPGGAIFKRHWFQYYDKLPDRFDEQLISFDLTFKDTHDADFVVGQVWGRDGANKYLIDQYRDRMDFNNTIKAFQSFANKWPKVTLKLVEDKANGPALISTLKSQISGIVPFSPDKSKVSRALSVSPQFEAGNIFLPNPAKYPWVNDYIEEFASFPRGAHDDQVDATTQALIRLEHSGIGNYVEEMVPDDNILSEDISEANQW